MRRRAPRFFRLRQRLRLHLSLLFGRLADWADEKAETLGDAYMARQPKSAPGRKPKGYLVDISQHGIWVEAPTAAEAAEQFLRADLKAAGR